MKINAWLAYILLALVAALVMAGVAVAIWFSSSLTNPITDEKLYAELVRIQGSTKVYYSRLRFYDGVCSDIGVREGYTCNEANQAFAIAVKKVATNGYFCVDSTGFLGDIATSLGTRTQCRP